MKRFPLHFFVTACCLPLLAVGCTDDTTGDDEVGPADTSTDEATSTDTGPGDTTTVDESTSDSTDNPTTDDDPTSDTDPTTDTGTETTETGTETGTETATDTETGGAVCGDMVIEGGEECEGVDLGGSDCVALGFNGGELLCAPDCTFDASACFNQECGNGVVEGDEQCDQADLGAATCGDFGFGLGELTCADDCTLITDACTNCGNDVVDDPELCDGADLGGETCVGLGYGGGELSCGAGCDAFDESLCQQSFWGEDFEGGAVLPAEWVLSGNANWFGSAVMPHAGGFDGENGNIGDSQSSIMTVSLTYPNAGTAQFWYRISTEQGWDFLRFYIDGVQQAGSWSGTIGWTQSPVYNLAAGAHTLRWSYVKDGSLSNGSDSVWVDDIVTTGFLP